MTSLFEILKANKGLPADDMYTALLGRAASGSPTPTEHEYTGAVPVTFTADGTPLLDLLISGNMVQTGTPTPTTPIQPSECGDLETSGEHSGQYKIPISSAGQTTPVYLGEVESTRKVKKLVLTGEEDWENSINPTLFGAIRLLDLEPFIPRVTAYCSHYIYNPIQLGLATNMVNGEFALQKSSNAFNLYIRNTDYTTRSNFKDYLRQQYATGTPVTVWYVLATEETGIVNEPLRKIGDYADTLSMQQAGVQIPTANGSTTLDVDTTLKPSEVYIKYR